MRRGAFPLGVEGNSGARRRGSARGGGRRGTCGSDGSGGRGGTVRRLLRRLLQLGRMVEEASGAAADDAVCREPLIALNA